MLVQFFFVWYFDKYVSLSILPALGAILSACIPIQIILGSRANSICHALTPNPFCLLVLLDTSLNTCINDWKIFKTSRPPLLYL